MTLFPQNETIVVDLAGNRCVVISNAAAHICVLQSAGFIKQEDQWVRGILSDADRQNLARALIEIGALFSAGRDWSPQELVEHYKEAGVISAPYRSISWVKPDRYRIADHA